MIILYGFGGVGRTLAEVIYARTNFKISGIFDSRGGVLNCAGFSKQEVMKLVGVPRGGVADSGVGRRASLDEALNCAEVVVDVSPPNYRDGEPAASFYRRALSKGLSVVTANKAPLALYFSEFADRPVYYKATVMAGTPVIDLAQGLVGQEIISIRGVLNGTTNYILTRVDRDGLPFESALEEAKRKGYVEPDPSIDLQGIDAAAKLVILSNTLGLRLALSDVERRALSYLGPRTKYVAQADFTTGRASVAPEQLEEGDFLLRALYTVNAVEIRTEVNEIKVMGKGAGRVETSLALLNDIMRALRERRR